MKIRKFKSYKEACVCAKKLNAETKSTVHIRPDDGQWIVLIDNEYQRSHIGFDSPQSALSAEDIPIEDWRRLIGWMQEKKYYSGGKVRLLEDVIKRISKGTAPLKWQSRKAMMTYYHAVKNGFPKVASVLNWKDDEIMEQEESEDHTLEAKIREKLIKLRDRLGLTSSSGSMFSQQVIEYLCKGRPKSKRDFYFVVPEEVRIITIKEHFQYLDLIVEEISETVDDYQES